MIRDVSGSSSEFKILDAIIMLDLVSVMDVLVGRENAPKMALHDETMLENVEPSAGDLYVSVFANLPRDVAVAALARTETHIAPSRSAFFDMERASARLADERDSHSNIPIR